jgi:hypothetical protein
VTKADGTIPLISIEGGPIYLVPGRYDVDLGNNEEGGTFEIIVVETSGSADISTLISSDGGLIFEASMYPIQQRKSRGGEHGADGCSLLGLHKQSSFTSKTPRTGNTGWREALAI